MEPSNVSGSTRLDEHTQRPIGVLIVDDHPLIREALRRAIGASDDMEVVGDAEDGVEGIVAAERLRGSVDVVVMDAAMPVMGGLEAAEHLIGCFPDLRIVMVSGYAETRMVRRAFQIGARGYLLKSLTSQQLLNGIRVVAGGGTILDPTLVIETDERPPEFAEGTDAPILTKRQVEVLWMIAEGYTN